MLMCYCHCYCHGQVVTREREIVGSNTNASVLSQIWKKLVLRLCLFHAMLLERQQYKSLGWRRPYEFSAADFLSTIKQVRGGRVGVGGGRRWAGRGRGGGRSPLRHVPSFTCTHACRHVHMLGVPHDSCWSGCAT